jgi:hypothetical protein
MVFINTEAHDKASDIIESLEYELTVHVHDLADQFIEGNKDRRFKKGYVWLDNTTSSLYCVYLFLEDHSDKNGVILKGRKEKEVLLSLETIDKILPFFESNHQAIQEKVNTLLGLPLSEEA